LGGDPAEVVARTATRSLDIEVEDTAAAVLTTTDGALMTAAVTLGAAKESSRLKFVFEHLTAESSQFPYKPGAEPWTFSYADKAVAQRAEASLAGWTPPLPSWRGQLVATHEALVSGGPLPVGLDEARRSLELVTAWYRSSRTGQPEALPLAPDHPDRHSWLPEDLR
jgi:predicted dehydrogenase